MSDDEQEPQKPQSVKNRKWFWEQNLQKMNDKKATTPPRKSKTGGAVEEDNDDSDKKAAEEKKQQQKENIDNEAAGGGGGSGTKAKKWANRVSANKQKKKPPPALSDSSSSSFRQEHSAEHSAEIQKEQPEPPAPPEDVESADADDNDAAADSDAADQYQDLVGSFSDLTSKGSGVGTSQHEIELGLKKGGPTYEEHNNSSSYIESSTHHESTNTNDIESSNHHESIKSSLTESNHQDDLVQVPAMETSDGDISLNRLFATAAALEVTLETERSATASLSQQELYLKSELEKRKPSPRSASAKTATSSSRDATRKTSTPAAAAAALAVTATSPPEHDVENQADAAAERAPLVAGATASASSPTEEETPVDTISSSHQRKPSLRLLYESDDEFDDYLTEYLSTGRPSSTKSLSSSGSPTAAAPMPWFTSVPYSDGKRKKLDDGTSVVSDDYDDYHASKNSTRVAGRPVFKTGHRLPYTILNINPSDPPPKPNRTQRKYILYILFCCLMLMGLIGYIVYVLLPNGDSPPPQASIINNATTTGTGIDIEVIDVIDVDTPMSGGVIDVDEKPGSQATPDPTMTPTQAATTTKTPPTEEEEPVVMEFDRKATITGESNGDRFGSVVSMSNDGSFLAVLSNSPTDPVRAFERSSEEQDWSPLPSIPLVGTTASSETSLAFGSNIATSSLMGSIPVVAISSRTQVEIYKLATPKKEVYWESYGQVLPWEAQKGVSHTSMGLSSDGTTLAVGCVDVSGTSVYVTVYGYDADEERWVPEATTTPGLFSSYGSGIEEDDNVEDAQARGVTPDKGTILSMNLVMSGDGNTLAVQEWNVGSPQVLVRIFEKQSDDNSWSHRGAPLELPFGPVSVALSFNGNRIALVAMRPGKSTVFDWVDNNPSEEASWKPMGGDETHGFLPGGSSVALARGGNRMLIGNAAMNNAVLYDFEHDAESEYYYSSEEWSAWLPIESFWYGAGGSDAEGGSFGFSVAMDESGSLLGIGAPASVGSDIFVDGTASSNRGSVLLYGL